MPDYSKYKLETLEKMLFNAETKYYELTMKRVGNWGDGMRLVKLPSMKAWSNCDDRVRALKREIERRKA